MSLPRLTLPDAPRPEEKPKKGVVGSLILGGALGCLALVTLASMARTVLNFTTAPTGEERRRLQAEFVTEQRAEAVGRPRHLIDFTLTNHTSRAVRRADLQGQWLVVNFVFSSCSLSCMKVNYRMAEIQKLVADQPDVRLVSLSIDPVTDTPSVLGKFAARFQADNARWLFLTGDRRAIHPLITQSFLGAPDPQLAGLIPGGWHQTDHIALVDPQGQLRGLFDGLRTKAPQEVVAALARTRKEQVSR